MPRRNSRARARNQTHTPPSDKPQRKPEKEKSKKGTPRRPQAQGKHFAPAQNKKEGPAQPLQNPRNYSGTQLVEGRVDLHPDGFGFLIPKDPSVPNIYLPIETLRDVMNRDEVKVQISQAFESGTKLRGFVTEITKRAHSEFLGIYRPHKGGDLIIPSEARDRKHIFKVQGSEAILKDAKPGATLLCKVIQFPAKGPGLVEVTQEITDPKSPSMDTLRVLVEAAWPREHSQVAMGEAETRALRWKENITPHRKDIRKLPLVTIDGADARDFDDAVCAQRETGGRIRLWVAIADVSMFVSTGTALDREAFAKSTSVYFPDHVVPMLPEVLSNGVCSLNPNEDRPCLVCEMVIGARGEVEKYEFYEGLMLSKKRLTYEQMQAFMEGEAWALSEMAELKESLSVLKEVFERLLKAKTARGAIDLDIPEAKVILNSDGTVRDIQPRTRLSSHRLIEECMLIANGCAANFLHENKKGAIYRIHEEPEAKKVQQLLSFLELNGLNLAELLPRKKSKPPEKGAKGPAAVQDGYGLTHPGDYARLIEKLQTKLSPESPVYRAVQFLLLRTQKQAKYSTQHIGHFALATLDYTHFTSPIRRYPDLMVHRLIKEGLGIGSPRDVMVDLESKAQHCSGQERLAMDCERKLIDIKKCRFMEPKLGEEFQAWASGMTEKGIFCQIDGHFVDGLLHADNLYQSHKLEFDVNRQCYMGPGQNKLQLGDRLKVLLTAVDIESRRIDFELVEILR